MISVIICTYNGEKYIVEQLQSIMDQTVMPDEVVIKDDCSNDRTVELCQEFINTNKLDWKVLVNDRNMGYRLNFVEGLEMLKGDIIFMCDQDDCWKTNKVERMVGVINSNPGIISLASTVDRIDDKGEIIERHLKHPYRKKNGLKQISEKEFLKFPQYMGMTMAIKKELVEEIDNEYADIISHDIFCNYYAIRKSGLFFLDEALTLRRSIGENTSYIEGQTRLEEYNGNLQLMSVDNNLNILELYKKLDETRNIQTSDTLQFNIDILRQRKEYLENKSVKGCLKYFPKMCKNRQLKQWIKDYKAIKMS